MKNILPLAALLAALFLAPTLRATSPLSTPDDAVTPKCFISYGETADFLVPALPRRVPSGMLVGVELRASFATSFNYGVENLTDEPVENSTWNRYIAHRIAMPGVSLPLTQVSNGASSSTGYLAPFDGTHEAVGFDPHDGADATIPAGPSGYWGGIGGSVPEAGASNQGGLEDLEFTYIYYHPSGLDFWHGEDGSVLLEYEPFGFWYRVDGGEGQHGLAWVDEIHGQIVEIESITYHLDRNGDGIRDYALTIPVE